MTSKERVTNLINRKPYDKIPLGFYAVDCDTIEKVIGHKTFVRNKVATQLALAEGKRDEVAESLKKDTVEFFNKIDCVDIILPKEAMFLPPKDYTPIKMKKISNGKWEDELKRVFQLSETSNELVCVNDPTIKDEYKVEDFKLPKEISPIDDSVFEVFDYLLEHLGEEKYIAGGFPITALTHLGSFENSLLTYAMNPEIIHAANKQKVFIQNQTDKYYARKKIAGAYIDQDMAGTNAPYISPNMFKEMCYPYMKQRITNIKKYTDQVILHNCGMNIPLMEMFIEAGINVYQSLQTTAGMDVELLKNKFGEKIIFWGGVSVEILISGTTEEVKKEVQHAIDVGSKNEGFILGPSHSIAYGVKYDNFMTMIDEYQKLVNK